MPAKPAAQAPKKATPKTQTTPAEVGTTAAPAVKPAAKSAPKATAKAAVKAVAKVAERPKPAARTPKAEDSPEKKQMEKDREILLAEKARLEAELEEIESRTSRTSDAERATELSSYDDHPADLASETFEREKDLAIGESVQSLLDQVHTALEKVERGTYGICDACGRPIKRARLQALPFATLCLECQDRLEG
jgi:RNA polymerase-binding protein DksA